MPTTCPKCKKRHNYVKSRGYPYGPDFIPTDSGRLTTNTRAKWCFDCCDEAKELPEFSEVKEEVRLTVLTELENKKKTHARGGRATRVKEIIITGVRGVSMTDLQKSRRDFNDKLTNDYNDKPEAEKENIREGNRKSHKKHHDVVLESQKVSAAKVQEDPAKRFRRNQEAGLHYHQHSGRIFGTTTGKTKSRPTRTHEDHRIGMFSQDSCCILERMQSAGVPIDEIKELAKSFIHDDSIIVVPSNNIFASAATNRCSIIDRVQSTGGSIYIFIRGNGSSYSFREEATNVVNTKRKNTFVSLFVVNLFLLLNVLIFTFQMIAGTHGRKYHRG